jgi:hypothetical protein
VCAAVVVDGVKSSRRTALWKEKTHLERSGAKADIFGRIVFAMVEMTRLFVVTTLFYCLDDDGRCVLHGGTD